MRREPVRTGRSKYAVEQPSVRDVEFAYASSVPRFRHSPALGLDRARSGPGANARFPNQKDKLLRQGNDRESDRWLRPACAEIGPGETMLRGLRLLPRHPHVLGDAIRLPIHGRRVFCRVRGPRAGPASSSSGSTAATSRCLTALARPAAAGRDAKRNSTGGFL